MKIFTNPSLYWVSNWCSGSEDTEKLLCSSLWRSLNLVGFRILTIYMLIGNGSGKRLCWLICIWCPCSVDSLGFHVSHISRNSKIHFQNLYTDYSCRYHASLPCKSKNQSYQSTRINCSYMDWNIWILLARKRCSWECFVATWKKIGSSWNQYFWILWFQGTLYNIHLN